MKLSKNELTHLDFVTCDQRSPSLLKNKTSAQEINRKQQIFAFVTIKQFVLGVLCDCHEGVHLTMYVNETRSWWQKQPNEHASTTFEKLHDDFILTKENIILVSRETKVYGFLSFKDKVSRKDII